MVGDFCDVVNPLARVAHRNAFMRMSKISCLSLKIGLKDFLLPRTKNFDYRLGVGGRLAVNKVVRGSVAGRSIARRGLLG